MDYTILGINPGSTSTEIAIYNGQKKIWEEKLNHSAYELSKFDRIIDQLEWRQDLILTALEDRAIGINELDAITARGGAALDPLPGGTYRIDQTMAEDLQTGKNGEHASNLAGIIAFNLNQRYGILAVTSNVISTDEFEPIARLSGLPGLPRRCQSHVLNLKGVARKTAQSLGREIDQVNLIGAHLGGGISIAPLKRGRIIDVNNANDGGPYSPERTGTLPVTQLIDYIYQQELEKSELKKKLIGKGGLTAYLGTNNGQEIEERIAQGNKEAELVYQGMVYQIGKEIGAMAAVLKGEVDAIFITGGLAYSDYVVTGIKEMVDYIAPIKVYPGAEEIRYLVEDALRVLAGDEKIKDYDRERKRLQKELASIGGGEID